MAAHQMVGTFHLSVCLIHNPVSAQHAVAAGSSKKPHGVLPNARIKAPMASDANTVYKVDGALPGHYYKENALKKQLSSKRGTLWPNDHGAPMLCSSLSLLLKQLSVMTFDATAYVQGHRDLVGQCALEFDKLEVLFPRFTEEIPRGAFVAVLHYPTLWKGKRSTVRDILRLNLAAVVVLAIPDTSARPGQWFFESSSNIHAKNSAEEVQDSEAEVERPKRKIAALPTKKGKSRV